MAFLVVLAVDELLEIRAASLFASDFRVTLWEPARAVVHGTDPYANPQSVYPPSAFVPLAWLGALPFGAGRRSGRPFLSSRLRRPRRPPCPGLALLRALAPECGCAVDRGNGQRDGRRRSLLAYAEIPGLDWRAARTRRRDRDEAVRGPPHPLVRDHRACARGAVAAAAAALLVFTSWAVLGFEGVCATRSSSVRTTSGSPATRPWCRGWFNRSAGRTLSPRWSASVRPPSSSASRGRSVRTTSLRSR